MTEVRVPDIGDFADVPIIEVLVAPGDTVAAEDPLITLESDKAHDGRPGPGGRHRRRAAVAVGDKVSEGSLDPHARAGRAATAPGRRRRRAEDAAPPRRRPRRRRRRRPRRRRRARLAAPAATRPRSAPPTSGSKTVLVERYETLGGVCLNVGCIPSKALLHVARVIAEGEDAAATRASRFGEPEIDLDGVRAFKDGAVDRLTGGLAGMAKQRRVARRRRARAASPARTRSTSTATSRSPSSTASSPPARTRSTLPGLPDDPRIIDSTGALELPDVPERLLVDRRRHHRPGDGHGATTRSARA